MKKNRDYIEVKSEERKKEREKNKEIVDDFVSGLSQMSSGGGGSCLDPNNGVPTPHAKNFSVTGR